MVCDDAICVGAETISITNTLDINKVDPEMMSELMEGLASACQEQKIVIPGGEIAELGKLVNGGVWNATAVGVVKKDRVITGADIKAGDAIISLYEPGFRSNGFSLVRYILEQKFGHDVYQQLSTIDSNKTWGELLLTPSTIYQAAILNIIGRFDDTPKMSIKGIAHITGGGIPGNLNRTLKKSGLGAKLTDLWEPSPMVKAIQELGNVDREEAYKTWNMGNGMMVVVNSSDVNAVIESLMKDGIQAKEAGEVTSEPGIIF